MVADGAGADATERLAGVKGRLDGGRKGRIGAGAEGRPTARVVMAVSPESGEGAELHAERARTTPTGEMKIDRSFMMASLSGFPRLTPVAATGRAATQK
jgi:hypothetical protein